MTKIRINPAGVVGASTMAESAKRAVGSVSSGISIARWGIDSRILARCGINGRLSSVQNKISQIESDIQTLYNTINHGATLYNATENGIVAMGCAMINGMPGGTKAGNGGVTLTAPVAAVTGENSTSAWKRFFDGDLKKEDSVAVWDNGLDEEKDGWHVAALGAGYSASVKPGFGSYEKDDWKELKQKEERKKVTVYDIKTGEEYDPESFKLPKKQITIAEVKAGGAAEASIFEAELTGDKKYGEYDLDVKCGVAEAHAVASAGLYTYDVNGMTLVAPAVDAKIGASVSALSVTAEGRAGLGEDHNMLGVYGEGSVDALKASGEAKAGVSVFNKEGDIDLNAYAEASAEAVLLEAKGTAGLSVLGADIGVSGSVNIGVGAHAKVGIEDGKVKIDVGASLGVGASVGFEVDVGGMVSAVCGKVESAWKGIKSWFS